MMKSYLLAMTILLLVGLSGCEKEGDNGYEAPGDQPVLFEYRYVNHAWGYSENGWLIDSNGNMKSYDLPEDFILPDSGGYISREDLVHNLSQTDSIIHNIGTKDLDYYTRLIARAAMGGIGKVENIAADAGSSVLSCYLYDANKDMYQFVFLAASGDWQQTNDAPEAELLVDWLKDIGEVFCL